MKYIWQENGWPAFEYYLSPLYELLQRYTIETSYLSGSVDHLADTLKVETLIDLMVDERMKTFEIEGEKLDMLEVRASLRHQLGLSDKPKFLKDQRAKGIAKLMLAIRKNYQKDLTKEELFFWHTLIMIPSHDLTQKEIGAWRTDNKPMQIISGSYGKEKVHYEAPQARRFQKKWQRL
jgi:Fic family protein